MARRAGSSIFVCSSACAAAAMTACVVVADLGSTGGGGDGGDDAGATAEAGPASDAGSGVADAGVGEPDGDARVVDPTKGPGPYGALPGGYCCEHDEDCRFRHCLSVDGGPKMCLDECSSTRQAFCDRLGVDFHCVTYTADFDSACEPPPGFTCLDPAAFVRGAKTTGDCCSYDESGLFGHECEANLCIATGDNPWVCTRFCEAGADCPAGYGCRDVAWRKECVPLSGTYACN